MLAQPIVVTGPAAVARSNAIAVWAREEITRQRGPRPTQLPFPGTPATTGMTQRDYIDRFDTAMRSRDAGDAWDRAVMDLIRRVEAGRVAA